MAIKRVFLLILDSFGIGAAPDAADFGDAGANTLASCSTSPALCVPHLRRLGLGNIAGMTCLPPEERPGGAFARLREESRGKDTTVGHWELAGLVSPRPLPTYPDGFPPELIREFERRTGHGVLCNRTYSGTQVIADYGREQIATGKLIVYTSADSVFQIAAHETYIGLDELYRYCRIARDLLQGEHGVGRVIARPYTGEYPHFTRTANRHDFSLVPPGPTMPRVLADAGFDVIGVGKIHDIFAGDGITETHPITSNDDGMEQTLALAEKDFRGLCFVNLVDFDSRYGHRRDRDGYAAALTAFDGALGRLLPRLRTDDLLLISADHGCDPGFTGTDHTREYVPLLAAGAAVRVGTNLGTRVFSDLGATVLDIFGVAGNISGRSFAAEILRGQRDSL
ncbi:MAG: phosphopentomutase [Clostridiaceae bacterium]|nr:phosphopentomutase [Clostridiaceae bacterium]